MSKKLVIAVDFDGTLCEYAFPDIGEQTSQQKELVNILISLKNKGHELILWTNRGDNEKYSSLTDAIEWCRKQGLEFNYINRNTPERELKKVSGPSPKIMADYYIDDKALEFGHGLSRSRTLDILLKL